MNFPTTLYNTRIHPLAPFALRGVIGTRAKAVRADPTATSRGDGPAVARTLWPGLLFHLGHVDSEHEGIATDSAITDLVLPIFDEREIRNAVEYSADLKAAMVELYDVGDHETHFLQKAEASRLIGLAALNIAYGQNDIYSGPLKTDLTIAGGKALVRFDRVGQGLDDKPSIDGISGVYVTQLCNLCR